jgi:hypothetical protein
VHRDGHHPRDQELVGSERTHNTAHIPFPASLNERDLIYELVDLAALLIERHGRVWHKHLNEDDIVSVILSLIGAAGGGCLVNDLMTLEYFEAPA